MSKRKHEGGDGEAVKKQCTVLIVEPCKAMVVWEPPFDMERYSEDYEERVASARELVLFALDQAYGIMEQLKDDYYLVYGPPAKSGCGYIDETITPRMWFVELAFREFYTKPYKEWEQAHGQIPTPPFPSHTANAATQVHPSSCICYVGSPADCVGQANAAPAAATSYRSR